MVLRSTSGSTSETSVLGAVHSVTQDVVSEDWVVGDAGGSQVMWAGLHNTQNFLNFSVTVLSHESEWSEKFSGQKLSSLLCHEVLERHIDGSWLIRSVAWWDRVVLKRNTTPKKFGTVELKAGVNVCLDSCVVPGENWTDGQVVQITLGSLSLPLVQHISLFPILVHEKN